MPTGLSTSATVRRSAGRWRSTPASCRRRSPTSNRSMRCTRKTRSSWTSVGAEFSAAATSGGRWRPGSPRLSPRWSRPRRSTTSATSAQTSPSSAAPSTYRPERHDRDLRDRGPPHLRRRWRARCLAGRPRADDTRRWVL